MQGGGILLLYTARYFTVCTTSVPSLTQDNRTMLLYAAMYIPSWMFCNVCTNFVASSLQDSISSGSINPVCTVKA